MAIATTTIIAAAAVAVAAGSAYAANEQSKEAASERKKAGKVSSAEQEARASESRRQQIREERVRRATILQSSENTGVTSSSGQLGAISALGSQVGGNISSINRQSESANAIGSLNQSAANLDYRAGQAQQIGGFAGTVFGVAAPMAIKAQGDMNNPKNTGKTNNTIFD